MQYQYFLSETQENLELISKMHIAVVNAVNSYAQKLVVKWRVWATQHRRAQLGYHPTQDTAPGFKTFDKDEYQRANINWHEDSDYIGDRLGREFLPPPEGQQHHEIYELMYVINKPMTKVLQDHVRKIYGDPVWLDSGLIERDVKDIQVLVWYKPRGTTDKYRGAYRARDAYGGVLKTTLEIVINRDEWYKRLKNVIGGIISYDYLFTEKFVDDIINTFMHEYAHFEQDVKGSRYSTGLIPYKGRRGLYPDWQENNLAYYLLLGMQSEIDAHATGAAAEKVNELIKRNLSSDGARLEIRDPEAWNLDIKSLLTYNPPSGEYNKYIVGFDKKYGSVPKEIKDKFIDKVRKRFRRTYVNRLQAYLKPIFSKRLAGPIGKLPQE
jgi:hypothetical protein